MSTNLPLHPSKLHPITGEPLRAIYVDKAGRARYPIMGGAEGDDEAAKAAAAEAAAKKAADEAAAKKAAEEKAEAEKNKGFPADTPVAEMTPAQQAAYWQDKARKHEQRATEYRSAAGGKTADEIKKELEAAETLRREKLDDHQRAVEDARREAREHTANEYGPRAVKLAFNLALRDMPESDRTEFIDELDLSKFLTDSGDVDTDKVLKRVEKIAPAGKGPGERRLNWNGGNNGDTKPGGSVAAVMEARRAAREGKQ